MKSQIGLFLPSCVHYVTVYSEFGSYNDQWSIADQKKSTIFIALSS
jgi:hypothetical protein